MGLDTLGIRRESLLYREESKGTKTLQVLGICLLFREGNGPREVEKDQQNRGEKLIMNSHISRREFQELGD